MTAAAAMLMTEMPDGVMVLEFTRPGLRNALDTAAVDALVSALTDFGSNAEARVLLITGAGSAFCAGGDLDEIAKMGRASAAERRDYLWRHLQQIPRSLERIDKPIIAAVNGAARGAGFDLALMCDLRLAARSATFAESYIKLGLVAGDGGVYYLTRLVGTARSLELLWTGRSITADEALAMGIVSEVIEDHRLFDRALTLARQIAAQPAEAVRMTKRAVYAASVGTLGSHLDMIASHMAVLYDSEEFQVRIRARRAPSPGGSRE